VAGSGRVARLVAAQRFALVAVWALVLAGCDNGPSAPSVDTFTFRGELVTDGRQIHNFALPDFEIVRVQLTDVRPILFEVTGINPSPLIGVGVGHLAEDGECATTSSGSFREGGFRVFGLTADEYCLRVFDPNSFPEDALVEYTVIVEPE